MCIFKITKTRVQVQLRPKGVDTARCSTDICSVQCSTSRCMQLRPLWCRSRFVQEQHRLLLSKQQQKRVGLFIGLSIDTTHTPPPPLPAHFTVPLKGPTSQITIGGKWSVISLVYVKSQETEFYSNNPVMLKKSKTMHSLT